MTTRSFKFASGEFYHIYNRGVDRRTIFLSATDHKGFLDRLYIANSSKSLNMRDFRSDKIDLYSWDRGKPQVAIGAYCLMPNHFHLLVTPLQEDGVATFMNKLGTSYAMYFNSRYERTGALFEGKFKAQWVDSDRYLKYLYSYIHLNPVKLMQSDWKEKGISDTSAAYEYALSYPYSSLKSYVQNNQESNKIISPQHFPAYFQTAEQEQGELMEWLSYNTNSAKGGPL